MPKYPQPPPLLTPSPRPFSRLWQVEWTEDAGVDAEGRERVRILRGVEPGQWTRAAGSDIAAGTQVLAPGTTLSASDIGLLAMVRRSHRAAFLSSACLTPVPAGLFASPLSLLAGPV